MENLPSEFESAMLSPDMLSMVEEFKNGKPIGESACIEALSDQFSWKKAFINCWTGFPNSGKTTLLMNLMLIKSIHDNWKWCIWSPEMISSHKTDKGKIFKSASDIYDELVHAYTGKNPYKHFTEKYGIPQMPMDEYMAALEWIQDRFFVISPNDKNYKKLIDTYNYWFEKDGFDGWIIDPFKNMTFDINGTMDNVLHAIFDEFKEVSIYTNTSINFVAHARSNAEPKNKDNSFKVVTQFDLLGGSAWNNSMDGIFSIHRPYVHFDPNDPTVYLYHLKQRKKHLVGNTGVFPYIEYSERENRFYYKGKCPISGAFKPPIVRDDDGRALKIQPTPPIMAGEVEQSNIEFIEKEKIDYNIPNGEDETPF